MVHGRADHWGAAGAGGQAEDGGSLPHARISETTFYVWKAKYGDLGVSEAKRLKTLKDEKGRLKRLLPRQCWTTPY